MNRRDDGVSADAFALAWWTGGIVRMLAAMGSPPALLPAVAIDLAAEADIPIERVLFEGWTEPELMSARRARDDIAALVRAARECYGLTIRAGRHAGGLEIVIAEPAQIAIDTEDWELRLEGAELITPDTLRWLVALEQRREVYMLAQLAGATGIAIERLASFTAGAEELDHGEAVAIAAELARYYEVTFHREGEALVMAFAAPHLFGLLPRADVAA
jgi:hypothetical protein